MTIESLCKEECWQRRVHALPPPPVWQLRRSNKQRDQLTCTFYKKKVHNNRDFWIKHHAKQSGVVPQQNNVNLLREKKKPCGVESLLLLATVHSGCDREPLLKQGHLHHGGIDIAIIRIDKLVLPCKKSQKDSNKTFQGTIEEGRKAHDESIRPKNIGKPCPAEWCHQRVCTSQWRYKYWKTSEWQYRVSHIDSKAPVWRQRRQKNHCSNDRCRNPKAFRICIRSWWRKQRTNMAKAGHVWRIRIGINDFSCLWCYPRLLLCSTLWTPAPCAEEDRLSHIDGWKPWGLVVRGHCGCSNQSPADISRSNMVSLRSSPYDLSLYRPAMRKMWACLDLYKDVATFQHIEGAICMPLVTEGAPCASSLSD